jgi:hypothetical protein
MADEGRSPGRLGRWALVLVAVDDPTSVEVVRRDLDAHAVAGEHADSEAAHLARQVREDGVPVLELDAEHRVGKRFDDLAVERDLLFNCQW